MKLTLNILLTIISLVLYFLSPREIYIPIIIADFLIFAIGVYDIMKIEWKDGFKLSFNFFFLISFFFVSFCFGVFIINSKELFDAFAQLSMKAFTYIDYSYITQATSLCLIAINLYFLGYKKNIRKAITSKVSINDIYISKGTKQKASYWATVLWVLTIANIYITIRMAGGLLTNLSERSYIYELYKCALAISLVVSGTYYKQKSSRRKLMDFFSDNTLVLIGAFLIVLFHLYIGDRGNAVAISLMLLCGCAFYYYRFRLTQIAIIGAIGTVLLFAIRQTRHTDSALSTSDVSSFSNAATESMEGQNALFFFSDLIGASQELCIGYAIKEERGLQYPSQILLLPVYPFPFLPSLGSELLFKKPLKEVTGVQVFSNYLVSSIGFDASYGKHCVSDIYMKWGIVGVIIFFYIFGLVIGHYCKNRDVNIAAAAIYMALISSALYLPRSSILDIIRIVAYTYLLYYIYCRKGMVVKAE